MPRDETQLDELVHRCRANLEAGRPPLDGLSRDEAEALRSRYSAFADTRDDAGFLVDSHVALHALRTPRPFLHLMASSHFGDRDQWGSFWDQHAGGFSCVDSVLAGKMTSHLDTNYVPTSPLPVDVRSFYVHEAAPRPHTINMKAAGGSQVAKRQTATRSLASDGGRSWPLFPVLGYEEEAYSGFAARLGLDTFELESVREALAAHLRVFVHDALPLEVWQITLANQAAEARDLSWFLRLRVNLDTYPSHYFVARVCCEGIVEDGALVFLNHDQGNKHPRAAFLASAEPFDGFDMMGEVFDGGPARAPIPEAVRRGRCFDSLGLQPFDGLIAAAQSRARLEPGERRTWTVVYGKCPVDPRERKEFLAAVRREVLDAPDACLARLGSVWRDKVLAHAIATPDGALDRYFNVWSKLQARNQARFVRALDKVGYRDILQDLLGVCDFEAPYVRRQLAIALRYQFPDGRAVRQYEKFLGGGHDLRRYQDSPSWVPDLLVRYLKETGDLGFLDEPVPFLDPEKLQPNERDQGSVYDHACRAVRSLADHTGFHGLCAIGYGDWNDAISAIGGEKGVSVWLSCACVYAARRMAELAARIGRDDDQKEFARVAEAMTERINRHAWDGQWYIYAINGEGVPIGSRENPEGQIHLNVNTWALFTGVAAAAGREEQVWDSIERLATPLGHMLLKPPYTRASRPLVGRIADQLPGMFENGSIYTHGESFYLYALVCAGRTDRWVEELPKTLPSALVPDISTCPPHQQSNFAVGPDHVACGTQLFSNFTGSLAWYRRSIERVVGLLPDFDGLRIDPRPPSHWESYRVTRAFRGARLDATFRRGAEARISLDGTPCGAFIPVAQLPAGSRHQLEVTYPAK